MKRTLIFISCLLLIACSKESNSIPTSPHQLNIMTTVYPLTYFTEQIGGQHITVKSVLEPGADLHQFHLSEEATNHLLTSDLILFIDASTETYLTDIMPSLDEKGVDYIDIVHLIKAKTEPQIAEGQTLISGILTLEESPKKSSNSDQFLSQYHLNNSDGTPRTIPDTIYSPYNHLWLHPSYSLMICEIILDQLSNLMPEYEPTFQQNFDQLKIKLQDLNYSFTLLSDSNQPYFLVTHAAYSTWESYGLIQIPLSSSIETPLSTDELTQLVALAQDLDLDYLYFESNISSLTGRNIQNQLNLKQLILYNLETLTNEQIKNNENYFTLMYQNIENLKQEVY